MHYNEVIAAEMKSLLEELHRALSWIEREDYGELTATTRRMHDNLIQLSGIANIISHAPTAPHADASLTSPGGVPQGVGRRPVAPEVLAEQPDDSEEMPDGKDVYTKIRRMGGGPVRNSL